MALVEATTQTGRGPWTWPRYSREATQRTISALLWTLKDMGGTIESTSGRAGSALADEAAKRGTPIHPQVNLSQLIGELDTGIYGGCIKRDTGIRRTYAITLLLAEDEMPPKPRHLRAAPEKTLFVQPVASDPDPEPEPEPEPIPVPPEPQPEPVVDTAVVVETVEPVIPPLVVVSDEPLDLALTAATSVAKVIEALLVRGAEAKGEPSPDAEEMAVRLAQTIEENNRLRRKVNDLSETVQAKAKECEGLHKALRVSEANLKTLRETVAVGSRERDVARLKGNQRFVAERPEPAILGRGR
jgi:hypothetical protein